MKTVAHDHDVPDDHIGVRTSHDTMVLINNDDTPIVMDTVSGRHRFVWDEDEGVFFAHPSTIEIENGTIIEP